MKIKPKNLCIAYNYYGPTENSFDALGIFFTSRPLTKKEPKTFLVSTKDSFQDILDCILEWQLESLVAYDFTGFNETINLDQFMADKVIKLPERFFHKTLVLCTAFERQYFIDGETDFLSLYKNKTIRDPNNINVSQITIEAFDEIIAMQFPSRLRNLQAKKLSFFNTEQLTVNTKLSIVINEFSSLKGHINYYDYSKKNIEIFKDAAKHRFTNFEAKFILLEPKNIKYLEKLRLITPKTFDFSFVGYLSEYRKKIINSLKLNGFSVNIIDNKWGSARDRELMKSNNLLNIPANHDYKIFEVSRALRLMKAGMNIYLPKNHYFEEPDHYLIKDLSTLINNNTKNITVLIRTNKRPNGFNRQMDLLMPQNPDRIIVSVHNDESYNYVKLRGFSEKNIIQIDESSVKSNSKFKYNLYMNYLIKESDLDTFLWMIDDDDRIATDAIQTFRESCKDNNILYFFKMNYLGTIMPGPLSWQKKPIINNIGTPNCVVHAKWAKKTYWEDKINSDGQFYVSLFAKCPKSEWINKIVYYVDKANFGKREAPEEFAHDISILIPTMPAREFVLTKLLEELNRQINLSPLKVEILVDCDDGTKAVGKKRNDLINLASGKYSCFIDDDDIISQNYVSSFEDMIFDGTYDSSCLFGSYYHNNIFKKRIHLSIQYKKDGENLTTFLRCPNHLNLIKTSIAKQVGFNDVRFGEDSDYGKRLMLSNLIKKEFNNPKNLYFYIDSIKNKRNFCEFTFKSDIELHCKITWPRILVKFQSKSPQKLLTTLKKYIANSPNNLDIKIDYLIINDDLMAFEKLKELSKSITISRDNCKDITESHDIIVIASDNIGPLNNWADIIVQKFHDFLPSFDGVLQFKDEINYILGREFYKNSNSGLRDNIIEAKQRNKYIYENQVFFG